MEKIDILMATYNGEKYLKQQIDSILSQTYKNFNLIISDDASTDSTQEILKEYEQKDKRVKVYIQEKNLGIIQNFEFLLGKVENKLFMFADQDDIWDVDKVEFSRHKLEADQADLVYTDLKIVDENLEIISNSYWKTKGFTKKIYKYNNFPSLYLNNHITGCTIMCKSKWIKEVLPLPKESKYVIHDYWLSLIVCMKGKVIYIDKPLIKYRQHKKNIIGSKRITDNMKSLDDIRNLFINIKKEHFKVFINNEEKFTDEYKELNKKSLKYFEMLENKNNFNFRNWCLFYKLYKYEKFIYFLGNFAILNLPAIGRILFKMKGTKNGK